ncbi:carbohydrate ABC transporter permease [Fredinandcohnia sp. QZ13]|uniref:carbohydrate ABC transporter permease n=1 Tax=Fredinandcohnia sp. QZ13 TaxID=3073144 RepID=UPI00285335D9|nr:carbohydrate ABC transporter permease [Fredinandcohnia sp. QZ13]MDR4886726.1 carbohydrate ABC transporter permease [Fredinandcohnia sp. QZ13]
MQPTPTNTNTVPDIKPKRQFRNLPSKRKISRLIISYFFLSVIMVAMVVPFLWSVSTALKGQNEAIFSFPPQFIPENITLDNFITVWNTLPIPLYLWNSTILAFWGVLLPLLFCSLAAFPLARMNFKGKNIVFLVILSTMMIPGEVTMIPIYLILEKLHLIGSFSGVILPGAVTAFGIFLMRQAFMGIPKEIDESAIIDGAKPWQIWWYIMIPMVKPMLATLAILSFIGSWNNFLWPLLVLQDPNTYPLTVGLYDLKGAFVTNTRLVSAGAIIALIPILLVFVAFQNYFIKGAYSSAVKG